MSSRTHYKCLLCGTQRPMAAFATGAQGEHTPQVRTCHYVGGGRAERPRVQARDRHGRPRWRANGEPMMVLAVDADGRPKRGPGFEWISRQTDLDEHRELVSHLQDAAHVQLVVLMEHQLTSANDRDFESWSRAFVEDAAKELTDRKRFVAEIAAKRKER